MVFLFLSFQLLPFLFKPIILELFFTVSLLKYLISLLFPISTVVSFNFFLIWFLFLIVFLVSYLRLLQVLLDIDLVTEVVRLNSSPGLVGSKPLSVEDGALHPLGSRGAQCLTTVISGLLLQVRIHFVYLSLFLLVEQQMILSLILNDPW